MVQHSEAFLTSLSSKYADTGAAESLESDQRVPVTGLLFPALFYDESADYYPADENWMMHSSSQWMYCLVDNSYYHIETDTYYYHDPTTGHFYEAPLAEPSADAAATDLVSQQQVLPTSSDGLHTAEEDSGHPMHRYDSSASFAYYPVEEPPTDMQVPPQPSVAVTSSEEAKTDEYFFIDFDQDIVFFTGEIMSDMKGKLEREDRHVTKQRLPLDVMAETQACCLYTGIFDGHGGSLCAQYCAGHISKNLLTTYQHARTTIVKKLKKQEMRTGQPATPLDLGLTYTMDIEALRRGLQKSFQITDESYLEIAEQKGLTDGCTALAVLLYGPDEDGSMKLVTAHVGDCRAVLCRGGEAVRLTEDHKPSRKDERRRIEAAGGKVANVRGVWRVMATVGRRVFGLSTARSIGDLHMKRPKNLVPSTPDLRVCTIDFYRDTFVVMGSDGVWDVVTDQEACDLVSELLMLLLLSPKLEEARMIKQQPLSSSIGAGTSFHFSLPEPSSYIKRLTGCAAKALYSFSLSSLEISFFFEHLWSLRTFYIFSITLLTGSYAAETLARALRFLSFYLPSTRSYGDNLYCVPLCSFFFSLLEANLLIVLQLMFTHCLSVDQVWKMRVVHVRIREVYTYDGAPHRLDVFVHAEAV